MVINKYRGTTLFESLLALVMTSMIAMSAFKYQQDQQQNAVADALANKMYLFSQTVREYVRDNQSAINEGTFVPVPPVAKPSSFTQSTSKEGVTTYVFKGVSWLNDPQRVHVSTSIPYFQTPVSFDHLPPLELRAMNTAEGIAKGDDAITVTVTGPNISINYGMLYDAKDKAASAAAKPAIAARAAVKAAGIQDPVHGVSTFNYTGGFDSNGTPAPIMATLNSPTAADVMVNPDQPIYDNIVFSGTGPGPENAMIEDVQGIQFNPMRFDNNMTGLAVMNFGVTGPPQTQPGQLSPPPGQVPELPQPPDPFMGTGVIDYLGTLNFAEQGLNSVINNPATITFASGSSINNLRQIQMMPTGGGSTINNVTSMTFTNDGKSSDFSGIVYKPVLNFFAAPRSQSQTPFQNNMPGMLWGVAVQTPISPVSGDYPVSLPDGVASASTHYCLLTTIQMRGLAQSSPGQYCQLYVDPATKNYRLNMRSMLQCSVSCFKFAP